MAVLGGRATARRRSARAVAGGRRTRALCSVRLAARVSTAIRTASWCSPASPAPTASRHGDRAGRRSSTPPGRPAGFLGTLGYRFAGKPFAGDRTTPEASDLFRLLREMRERRARRPWRWRSPRTPSPRAGSSGALFDVAVFTNLTRDHFDFHPRLGGLLRRQAPVVRPAQAGRPGGGERRRSLRPPPGEPSSGTRSTFGDGGRRAAAGGGARHPWHARDHRYAARRAPVRLDAPAAGYNLHNLLAAAAAAEALGLPHAAIGRGFAAHSAAAGPHGAGGIAASSSRFMSTTPTPTRRWLRRCARCASSRAAKWWWSSAAAATATRASGR